MNDGNRLSAQSVTRRWTARRTLLGAALLGVALVLGCTAQAPAGGAGGTGGAAPQTTRTARTLQELATYSGPDRQQVLEDGAREEKELLWYTSLIVEQAVRPLTQAFQAKYPYLTVEHYRGNSTEIAQRVISEYQAQRHAVSVVDGTGSVPALDAAGVLVPFTSPQAEAYSANLKNPDGKWVAFKLSFSTLGYNTRLVAPAEAPKTYDDLLDPKWKGKMAWSTSPGSGGPDFVGNILQTRGQEAGMAYLRRLAQQDVRNYSIAVRAVLDQVIAGESPIGLHISNHHAIISKGRGAPVDWVPLDPVPVSLQSIALPAQAASPHAALLFIDFLLSEEGQRVLRDNEYIPARPGLEGVAPGLRLSDAWFKVNVLNPDEVQAKEREWVRTFEELFVR